MQLRSSLFAALLSLTSLGLGCATHSGRQGGKAPGTLSFELKSTEGKTVRSADFAGRVVLVDLWATWCRPCEHSMPFYSDLQQRLSPRGFTVLAVSVDEHDEDVSAFLARHPLPFPVLRDPRGTVPAMLDVAIETMPTSIILGPDGRILHVHAGFVDEDKAQIEGQVEAALAQSSTQAPEPGDRPKDSP